MSFILEALKKSENERQRQAGPGFAAIPETSGHKSRGRWPLVVAGLLILNLAVVAYVLLRDRPQPATMTGDAGSARQAGIIESPATPAPVVQEKQSTASTRPAVNTRQAVSEPDPPGQSSPAPQVSAPIASERQTAPANRQVRPLSAETLSSTTTEAAAPIRDSSSTSQPATATEPAAEQSAERTPSGTDRPATRAPSRADEGLPTANDLRLQGFLTGPSLHLDLHVYYPDKQKRVVFISGSKYREGDRVKGGAVVREIVPEGVILEDRGRRFLLEPN